MGIPFGHVSTGCFYYGQKPDGSGFRETDAPNFDFRHNNAGFYSGCKALAEEVISEHPQTWLWRLRYPFSRFHHKKNYISKILRYDKLVEARNSISELEEFTATCTACVAQGLPFGKYNVTNPGSVTTREVVEIIRKCGMDGGRDFRFFADESEFMKEAAKVPRANCVLDSGKIMSHGVRLTEVHDALEKCLRGWAKDGYPTYASPAA
jgi:nucleoside-diphosphate-sugar epimerase